MYGKKRVVITGLGAVTPVGTDVETAWENIKKGVSGIGRLTRIDPELFPAKVAAEINDFEVEKYIDKKKRRMDRFTQHAVAAAKMAVADAKLEITEENHLELVYGLDLVLAVWKHTKNNLRFY